MPTLNLAQYAIKTSLHIQAVFVSALNVHPYTFCKLHTYKLLICNSCRLMAAVKIIWVFFLNLGFSDVFFAYLST